MDDLSLKRINRKSEAGRYTLFRIAFYSYLSSEVCRLSPPRPFEGCKRSCIGILWRKCLPSIKRSPIWCHPISSSDLKQLFARKKRYKISLTNITDESVYCFRLHIYSSILCRPNSNSMNPLKPNIEPAFAPSFSFLIFSNCSLQIDLKRAL